MSTNVVSVKGEGGMGLSEIDNQRWWDTHNKFKEEQWISMCLIIITLTPRRALVFNLKVLF